MGAEFFRNANAFKTTYPFKNDLSSKLKITNADVLVVQGIAALRTEYSKVLAGDKLIRDALDTELSETGIKITDSILNPSRGIWDLVFELKLAS